MRRKMLSQNSLLCLSLLVGGAASLLVLSERARTQEKDPKKETLGALGKVFAEFDVKDVDVRHVIDTLFKDTNVNVVVNPRVQGTVSVAVRGLTREALLNRITKAVNAYWKLDEDGVLHILPAEAQEEPQAEDVIRKLEDRIAALERRVAELEKEVKALKAKRKKK